MCRPTIDPTKNSTDPVTVAVMNFQRAAKEMDTVMLNRRQEAANQLKIAARRWFSDGSVDALEIHPF